MNNLAKYDELWIALAGFLGKVIAQHLISGTAAAWTSAVIPGFTAAGVFATLTRTDHRIGEKPPYPSGR